MGKLKFGIDIDLTVVDTVMSDGGWFDKLKAMSHSPLSKEDAANMPVLPYALGELFPMLTRDESQHFWKSPTLYDKLTPYDNCVNVINWLASKGHNIYFVSHCRPEHYTSKFNFTKKHFDIPKRQFAFVSTEEKGCLDVDIMIDDRHVFHNQFVERRNVIKILMETKYKQDQMLLVNPDLRAKDWYDVERFLKEIM